MAKQITLTDIERRNAEIERTLEAVRSDRDEARAALRESRQETSELRRTVERLQGELKGLQYANADLQRNIGVLEGYRLRVERVDDLDRGLPPFQRVDGSRPDAAAGPNPHYCGPRDGFFQR